MKFIVENWALIIAFISILIVAIVFVVSFFKQPTSEQIKAVKEWLLFCVSECERALGSKTGQLKLRMAYDMFLEKFPYFVQFITFDKFSELVDEALEEMKKLLSSNKAIQSYIGVKTNEDNSVATESEVAE